jgi:hypothetical protein
VRVSPARALAGIVCVSALCRAAVAFARPSPTYFPDEYLYSAMARSIAETGKPLVRGASAHIPSVLAPYLTAPAWLLSDTDAALVTAQLVSALAMSLAAVPVYHLGKALGLRAGAALGAAAFTVAVPGMMYATTLIGEPFAYPLALAAVASGTLALGRGDRRAKALFLAFAAAAALARAQLLVIPLAYVAATLIVGLRARALEQVLRVQAWVLGTILVSGAALLLAPGALGIYGHSGAATLERAGVATALARNGLVLLYGSGWVIVPAGLIGVAVALARPRSATELAFAAFALPLGAGLLLQASIWGETNEPQERYVIYAVPLLAVGFALAAARAWPWRRAHGALAAGLILLAPLFPLSAYASAFLEHSPTLWGVASIESRLGTADGDLAVMVAATCLSFAALGLPLLGRRGALGGLGLATVACAVLAVCATSLDLRVSRHARDATFGGDPAWVDRASVGGVTFLRNAAAPGDAFSQLFWNRSVGRVVLLPHATPLDVAANDRADVAADGTVTTDGSPVTGALLVDQWAALLRFRDARVVAASGLDDLVVPRGRAQLELMAAGFYRDGTVGGSGGIAVWPSRAGGTVAGRVTFSVTAPRAGRTVALRIAPQGGKAATVRLAPGTTRKLTLAACGAGPWTAALSTDRTVWNGSHLVGLETTAPRWRPDPSACGRSAPRDASTPA